ncbi:uncharacterized protein FIBRA_07852 [Fibroporia radiculosa]|uniref:Gpi1-domain-containing protein n=1 Tax=Fibroporia radiculosa TaxID=599839 RepID=J4GFQ6_9APHY|nr:uncharacterized protein FIBRA_07852 [Fibroporia radiculosa]CCM05623.1 predicted protein [Fibroporia radiculosa]
MGVPKSVLWPTHVFSDGYFYGWTSPLICVAGIIQAETKQIAEANLHSVVASPEWGELSGRCGCHPVILGFCSFDLKHTLQPPRLEFYENKQDHDIEGNLILIYYRQPKHELMQFYSLDVSELDILPSQPNRGTTELSSTQGDTILMHDFTKPSFGRAPALNSLVLHQINAARMLSDMVERSNLYHEATQPPVLPMVTRGDLTSDFTTQFQTLRSATARAMHFIVSHLRNISATVEQFDIRFEQASFVHVQHSVIYSGGNSRSVTTISRYVKFYNCIWLVLNDIIIGIAFGSFICENHQALSHLLQHWVQLYLVDHMQRALLWLNDWPAGLKLNTELSQFYCHTLLGIISIWGQILRFVSPYFPAMFWTVGVMGCCGMTMIISLFFDALKFFTAHLYLCYLLVATTYRYLLGFIGSLWNLFRGKRFNVLRNRLDSWDYDIDQLLLGTILFTLTAFLYPTVLTYYSLFAMTHLVVIMLQAILDTVSALLNHFPLFALMLRIKDPMRMPGRVTLKRTKEGTLMLENQPAQFSSIFTHYAHLWSRLSSHYHPLQMLNLLVLGRRLTPISRALIRFSMITDRRDVSSK